MLVVDDDDDADGQDDHDAAAMLMRSMQAPVGCVPRPTSLYLLVSPYLNTSTYKIKQPISTANYLIYEYSPLSRSDISSNPYLAVGTVSVRTHL